MASSRKVDIFFGDSRNSRLGYCGFSGVYALGLTYARPLVGLYRFYKGFLGLLRGWKVLFPGLCFSIRTWKIGQQYKCSTTRAASHDSDSKMLADST